MLRSKVNIGLFGVIVLGFGNIRCDGTFVVGIAPENTNGTEAGSTTPFVTDTTTPSNITEAPPKPAVCPWSCDITSPASSCGRPWTPVKKIAGGARIRRDSWPWMGALWSNGKLICGATLICKSWVLTAAHCFLNTKNTALDLQRNVTLYLGRYLKKGNHRTVRKFVVTEKMVTVHWAYSIRKRVNDIALIRLPKPMQLTRKIRPICLPEFGKSAPKPGKRCRVAGWGDTMGLGPSNYRLKETTVPIVSPSICKFAYYFAQTEKVLCAGGEEGQDTCTGDSGGPLVCESESAPGQWQLQGLVSFGAKTCGAESSPAIYTQIACYLMWIYDVVETDCSRWRNA